eukprot:jgi/Psemu1/35304/gm1.35304_g
MRSFTTSSYSYGTPTHILTSTRVWTRRLTVRALLKDDTLTKFDLRLTPITDSANSSALVREPGNITKPSTQLNTAVEALNLTYNSCEVARDRDITNGNKCHVTTIIITS